MTYEFPAGDPRYWAWPRTTPVGPDLEVPEHGVPLSDLIPAHVWAAFTRGEPMQWTIYDVVAFANTVRRLVLWEEAGKVAITDRWPQPPAE